MVKLTLPIPRGRDVENWEFIKAGLSKFNPELKEKDGKLSIILHSEKQLNQILKMGAIIGQWMPSFR